MKTKNEEEAQKECDSLNAENAHGLKGVFCPLINSSCREDCISFQPAYVHIYKYSQAWEFEPFPPKCNNSICCPSDE